MVIYGFDKNYKKPLDFKACKNYHDVREHL